MHTFNAHAATDITGFGILGHAQNLARQQRHEVSFVIHNLPIIAKMAAVSKACGNRSGLLQGTSPETSGRAGWPLYPLFVRQGALVRPSMSLESLCLKGNIGLGGPAARPRQHRNVGCKSSGDGGWGECKKLALASREGSKANPSTLRSLVTLVTDFLAAVLSLYAPSLPCTGLRTCDGVPS